MKSSTIALVLASAGSFVAASPSGHRHHQHKHAVKRSPGHTEVVTAATTVVAYEYQGHVMPQSEVCQEIQEGKVKFANKEDGLNVCSTSSQASVPAPAPTPTTTESSSSVVAPIEAYQKPASSTSASSYGNVPVSSPSSPPSTTASSVSVAAAPAASSASLPSSSSPSSSVNTNPSSGEGLDKPFPDHEIDCSDFPSDYGPIELSWLGFGGYSGIQYPTISGNVVTDIVTAVVGGQNCTAGAMCSYACPPGYQKSQWPPTQGSTGQSVGGLLCSDNNKLVKTNPELSEYLCIKGTGATQVRNTMSKNAAICRTDYPGMSAL